MKLRRYVMILIFRDTQLNVPILSYFSTMRHLKAAEIIRKKTDINLIVIIYLNRIFSKTGSSEQILTVS